MARIEVGLADCYITNTAVYLLLFIVVYVSKKELRARNVPLFREEEEQIKSDDAF